MNIFELPERDFLAMLPELAQQGVDTDDLRRRYREANILAGPAAQRAQDDVAARGRRSVAGGLLSKPEGATGMDAVRGLEIEPMTGLLNALSGAERAITAPSQANLIPQQDMTLEALGTAGLAMTGGGVVGAPRGSIRSGLARNVDGLTPAQQMARDILELRAAGRASEVTDDMMAAADPQYMFANTPLPMDEASRLARAREMGFDTDLPLYHGTTSDFAGFDLRHVGKANDEGFYGRGVYSTPNPRLASDYAWELSADRGGRVLPIVSTGRHLPLNQSSSHSMKVTESVYGSMPGQPPELPLSIQDAQRLQSFAEGAGQSGIDVRVDSLDPYGLDVSAPIHERVTFDPANIRSRFARFDPEFSHLSNLNAANASAPTGLLAVQGQQEQVPPFMSFVRGLLQ